jgi:hypothetical protein
MLIPYHAPKTSKASSSLVTVKRAFGDPRDRGFAGAKKD